MHRRAHRVCADWLSLGRWRKLDRLFSLQQGIGAGVSLQGAFWIPALGARASDLFTLAGSNLSVSESTAHRYTLQDPDVRLMLQVRADDASAMNELVLRYQNRLVSLLAHLVGRRDMAEDLAQDVLLRVWRARGQYVPGSKFSTWLFTIANNVARNALRSMSRRREVHLVPSGGNNDEVRPLEAAAIAASGLMPSRQVDKEELQAAVRAAIETLNERQRMAVLLSKFEHLSYTDIAEIMDMSPQAIKSLLSRARGKLREVLGPYLEGGAKIDV